MTSSLDADDDVRLAIERLSQNLRPGFSRAFFGADYLERLERTLERKEPLSDEFLTALIVQRRGAQLLADRPEQIGREKTSIRRALLEKLSDAAFEDLFRRLLGHAPPTDRRQAEMRLAKFKWQRGSRGAQEITRALALPIGFAGTKAKPERQNAYQIEPIGELPPLKDYQRGILIQLRRVLEHRPEAMVSSFTGTGKTRLGMEFAVETLTSDADAPVVIWTAQKRELLEQANDSIDQLWPWLGQSYGEALQVFRYFDSVRLADTFPDSPTLVLASAQQLLARMKAKDPFALRVLSRARLLVIDEAHHALAPGHKLLIEAYKAARFPRRGRVLGLTATPGRSNLIDREGSRKLAALFGHTLIVPRVAPHGGALAWFQKEGYLSSIRHRNERLDSQVPQTIGKLKNRAVELDQTGYRDYTAEFLEIVGLDSLRNRQILKVLGDLLAERRHMLVFCCNIEQAELLADAMTLQGTSAGVVHHRVDARDRHQTIARFRRGEIRVLFNVEVLTTGFDAPRVDTIVMCRPTLSRVLYEQMVGRGMRGPLMGGTPSCEIVDFTTNFGRFDEPQAWEAFWKEWQIPEGDFLEATYQQDGWQVVTAEPLGQN